jgi:hypothetical protein
MGLYRSVVRYTISVYGELAQNTHTLLDLESVIEIRPRDRSKLEIG